MRLNLLSSPIPICGFLRGMFAMNRFVSWLLLAGIMLFPLTATKAFSMEEPLPTNHFAGFETHYLPNGLKIWFKQLPHDPNVSIVINTGGGRDQDPVGKEQMAHLLEHTLHCDHRGKSELEIKQEIEDLGGWRNAYTYLDHTSYNVRLAKEHGLFGIEWLYHLVSPHSLTPEIVEQQKQPLVVEIEARPRNLLDHINSQYVNPSWLRFPSFWLRGFGIETRWDHDYDPFRSVFSIQPEDLHLFYETHFTPSAMTLVVIGDFDFDEVLQQAEKTFGTLEPRPAVKLYRDLIEPGRGFRMFTWGQSANASLNYYYRFYSLSAEEKQMALFLKYWFSRKLSHRLRFGERKSVYGLHVQLVQRGAAAYLSIRGDIQRDEIDHVRQVIEEEIDMLRSGRVPEAEFAEGLNAIHRAQLSSNTTAEDLEWWACRQFYSRDAHEDFPDLGGFLAELEMSAVTRFASENLVPEREDFYIHYPIPISLSVLIAAGLLLLIITFKFTRRMVLRPIDLSRFRYIARFRMGILLRSGQILGLGLALAVLARLLVHVYSFIWFHYLAGIDNFWVQWSLFALGGMILVCLLLLALSLIPHRILLFEDHLRIKYLFCRTRVISFTDIGELRLGRFVEVWLNRRFFRTCLLALGLFSPGIILGLKNGWLIFFQVRNSEEFLTISRSLAEAQGVDLVRH